MSSNHIAISLKIDAPIQKVWKILGKKLQHDEYYDIGGSE